MIITEQELKELQERKLEKMMKKKGIEPDEELENELLKWWNILKNYCIKYKKLQGSKEYWKGKYNEKVQENKELQRKIDEFVLNFTSSDTFKNIQKEIDKKENELRGEIRRLKFCELNLKNRIGSLERKNREVKEEQRKLEEAGEKLLTAYWQKEIDKEKELEAEKKFIALIALKKKTIKQQSDKDRGIFLTRLKDKRNKINYLNILIGDKDSQLNILNGELLKEKRKSKKLIRQKKSLIKRRNYTYQNYENELNNKDTNILALGIIITNLNIELNEKDDLIKKQAARIRELEDKPPVVSVETYPVEKEVVKEIEVEKPVEKKVEVEKILEVESSHQKKEIERLKTIIQSLEQQLAQQKKTNYPPKSLPTGVYM